MKHCYSLDGYGYRLRPIKLSDASFIIQVRLEDMDRNRYINPISTDVSEQENWLNRYFEREGDYYFVIESRLSGKPEGLISFYDKKDGRAEWGRWVIKKGSLAAAESVYLLYRIAFEKAGLQELYCRTLSENAAVVSFHTSIGEKTRGVVKNSTVINGKAYDTVEQYADREHFYNEIGPLLEKKSQMITSRNLKRTVGLFSFHHIGVATRSIDKELSIYTLMGYKRESNIFDDPAQGIRGLFITAKDQPRLELLENLEGSKTLDIPLKRGEKLYHIAYYVQDIEKAVEIFTRNRAIIVSPLKQSVYFGKRICFMVFPNMMMIELVEK